MDKKVIWIDMDGVIVDFEGNMKSWLRENPNLVDMYRDCPDHIPDIFKSPKPIKGSIEAINILNDSGLYDLHIATAAPWGNPDSLTQKRLWIENHFEDIFKKKFTVTHTKNMLIGDFLIDDRLKNGAAEFKGELIRFGWDYENSCWNKYPNWESVLTYLLPDRYCHYSDLPSPNFYTK